MIELTDEAIEHRAAGAATWIDPATGLEWQCDSPSPIDWHAAQAYADALSIDRKADWRLPTVNDLNDPNDHNDLNEQQE
jgi:hypothetical protein